MGAPRALSLASRFDFLCFGPLDKFLYREMTLSGGSFWVSVSTLLCFINRLFFRVEPEGAKSDVNEFVGNEDPDLFTEFKFMQYDEFLRSNVGDGDSVEEEGPNLFTEFKFMSYDEFIRSNVGNGDSDIAQTSTNNGVVMEEPEATSFTLTELYADTNNSFFHSLSNEEASKGLQEQVEEVEDVHEGVELLSEKDLLGSDSDPNCIASGNDFSGFRHFIDSKSFNRFEESVDDTLDSGNVKKLIEQLKKVKATAICLPTILEESEYPNTMEDLKPLKIDHEDTIGDLHRFHKSYTEKMKKLDILSCHKMNAIGFLKSKEPPQPISFTKSTLLDRFKLCRSKKAKSDPMVKLLRELHSDLETVYVEQVCFSWEFLQWQYGKTLELCEADPHRMKRYNEVAGEFQQFQVLIQRFIENEPFEGHRVLNYVRNRFVLFKLLQVPIIREDAIKVQRNSRSDDDGAITSDVLVNIMEESIRMFWKFIRTDKGTNKVMQIGLDPSDKKLLFELKEELDKKERKVKEMMRSGKSMVRRILRHEEKESSEQVVYIFWQVEMKVVARVLRMSRITMEQLLWCRDKLSRVSFVDRRISVEPSFLLFPC